MSSSDARSPMRPTKRQRFARSVFLLPSLFTVGNIFCGYFAIIATIDGNYDMAAQAIGIAIVLDMLDGRVARLTNSSTQFGLQLDSLADLISFGIAPSILAFFWGLAALNYRLGWIAAFTFTICGAMRLARFNTQSGNLKHFAGLPIPAAGGTIAAIVHFVVDPLSGSVASTAMTATVFMLSFLMVSTLRYTSFKSLTLGRKSHLTVLVLALIFALIYFYSRWTLLLLATAYVVSGLLLRAHSLLKRRTSLDEIPMTEPR